MSEQTSELSYAKTKSVSKEEARTNASKSQPSMFQGGKGGRHRKARGRKTGDQVPAWAPESLLEVTKSLDIILSLK